MRRAPLFSVLAALAVAAPARAFVCTRASDQPSLDPLCPPPDPDPYGPSLAWFRRTITYALHATGTSDIPGDEEFAVLAASFVPWEQAEESRSPFRRTDLRFTQGPRSSRAFVGFNFLDTAVNENLLIFQDARWPHAGSGTIALTTTTFNPVTGEIFDADIELNSADNAFTVDDIVRQTDLMNTAVHEIGHFLGLAHVPDRPNCTDTMCRTAQPQEIEKRDLTADDQNGIVFKYPAGQENGYCAEPIANCGCCKTPQTLATSAVVSVTDSDAGTGCAAVAPALATLAALAALAGLALLSRRRR